MFMASSAHVTREIYTCLGELTLNIVVGLHVTLAFLLWMTTIQYVVKKNVNCCLLFLKILQSSYSWFKCIGAVQINRIWKCWFLRRWKNQSTLGETLQSNRENQQQTQPR